MPGPLKNSRHERFAQELAKGQSATSAYVAAGYQEDRGAASRLSAKINIQARATELRAKAAEKAVITVADIASQLDEDRKFARELKQPAAAVSATMGKAKVLGLVVDKTQHSVDLSNLSEDELRSLEAILGKTSQP